jgi:hypothetical protein
MHDYVKMRLPYFFPSLLPKKPSVDLEKETLTFVALVQRLRHQSDKTDSRIMEQLSQKEKTWIHEATECLNRLERVQQRQIHIQSMLCQTQTNQARYPLVKQSYRNQKQEKLLKKELARLVFNLNRSKSLSCL